ncbi:MAG: hypothetical protein AAB925_02380 [Patescibacteria group bacterium]
MQKKVSTLVGTIIIVAVAVILFGGVFAYQYFTTKSQQNSLQQNSEFFALRQKTDQTQNLTTETAGWKTYRNEKYGFEFNYPKEWHLWEANSFLGLVIIYPNDKSEQVLNKTISTTDEISFQPVDNLDGIKTQQISIGKLQWLYRIMPNDNPLDGGTEKGVEYLTAMNNNKYMDVATGLSNEEILLKILSTFKFTK